MPDFRLHGCFKRAKHNLMQDDAAYELFAARPALSAAPPPVYLAVTSTGIFCRPGCPARMPKRENCEFYDSPEGALSAGYRACKRCHPTRLPGEASDTVKSLIALVETDPEHKWGEQNLKTRGIDPSTARRQFLARFGMSFSAYARAPPWQRGACPHKRRKRDDRPINRRL